MDVNRLIGALLLTAVAGCGPAPAPGSAAAPAPASASASAPGTATTAAPAEMRLGRPDAVNATPTVAADGPRVVVAWTATTGDRTELLAATSHDGGRTFAPAVRVNDLDGDVRAGGEQAPRVALLPDHRVEIVWTSRVSGASRIRLAESRDDGATFTPARTLHEDGLQGIRGWTSLAASPSGMIAALWLDGRHADQAAAGHHAGHSMRQDVYFAATQAGVPAIETMVASNVCFCCKTSIALAADGTIYAAWRHVYPVDYRDIAVASSADGGRTFSAPARVSEDGWQVAGCPEDGPSIAVDDAGTLHVVWATMVARTGRKDVFYSTSADRGRTFSPRVAIGTGETAAHALLRIVGGRPVAVWDETPADGPRRLMIRDLSRVAAAGRADAAGAIVAGTVGRYPSLAAVSPTDVVAVWATDTTAASAIAVRRIARP